jgi:hypothetical protein
MNLFTRFALVLCSATIVTAHAREISHQQNQDLANLVSAPESATRAKGFELAQGVAEVDGVFASALVTLIETQVDLPQVVKFLKSHRGWDFQIFAGLGSALKSPRASVRIAAANILTAARGLWPDYIRDTAKARLHELRLPLGVSPYLSDSYFENLLFYSEYPGNYFHDRRVELLDTAALNLDHTFANSQPSWLGAEEAAEIYVKALTEARTLMRGLGEDARRRTKALCAQNLNP